VGSLAAWLHTIARNRTVDRLRSAGRRPSLVPFSASSSDDTADTAAALDRLVATGTIVGGAGLGPGPEGELAATELRHVIRDALDDLPDVERTAIVLAYREELSQSEIAERLGWPLGTVKTRTRRALLRLRGALAEELGPGAEPAPIPVPIGDGMNQRLNR
jgi:RNA polymerase sigma-70 factor (ECF subfamily)